MKPWLLRLHRWLSLLFSVPLGIVIVTGLILSFEPIATTQVMKPGSLKPEALASLVAKHDPNGRAQRITIEHDTRSIAISAGRSGPVTRVALEGDGPVAAPGRARSMFLTSRRLHESLLIDARWIVDASTIALLVLIALGVLMGVPTLRNTLAGWHKGIAWGLLPLLVMSPLTGLGIAFGITLAGPSTSQGPPPASLSEAMTTLGRSHDVSNLIWLRKFGSRLRARLVENGEYKIIAVTKAGASVEPRNWPRLLHEGTWFGSIAALANTLVAIAFAALMVTGLTVWARRRFRTREPGRGRASPA